MPLQLRPELDPIRSPIDAFILAGLHATCVPTSVDGCLAHVQDEPDRPLIVRGILAATPRVPGAVAGWLDTLPLDRKVVVPAVVSGRLAGMLERRGFRPHLWMDHEVGLYDNQAMAREATT